MTTWHSYLAVGLGAALGSALRYLVSVTSILALGPIFPWGTLVANVAGSWLIGWLAAINSRQAYGRLARWQPFLMTGFCGGFTTFSLFSLETLFLVNQGKAWLAVLYIVVSLPLWLVAAWHGHRVALSRL